MPDATDSIEKISFVTPDGLVLYMYRIEGKGPPLLLMHGASADHRTFLSPGPGSTANLVGYLKTCESLDFDFWMPDWRASYSAADAYRDAAKVDTNVRGKFTFDAAARFDVPTVLEVIQDKTGQTCRHAVGHCMGAAVLAYAAAEGRLAQVTHLVLSAMGLYYSAPLDGALKAEDRLLQRLWDTQHCIADIDPRISPQRADWPMELEALYEGWLPRQRPHDDAALDTAARRDILETCNRISFMFGEPYRHTALAPEIHAKELPNLLGAIPLGIYLHSAQNFRRGWAAPFDAGENDRLLIDSAAHQRFQTFEKITLITGAMNRLWHRDSIDRMYEWLRRGPQQGRIHKHVLQNYGHQDLLWSINAERDVFPVICAGLT